jgi:hypothetical protein
MFYTAECFRQVLGGAFGDMAPPDDVPGSLERSRLTVHAPAPVQDLLRAPAPLPGAPVDTGRHVLEDAFDG